MGRRILVALDGTPRSAAALALVRQLAPHLPARVTLLRVAPEDASPAELAAAQHQLNALATRLRAEGVDAHALLDAATLAAAGGGGGAAPSAEIAATARSEHSDVIVLAPRARRGLLAALRQPSVTAQLLSRSPAPLLIWPARTPPTPPATPTPSLTELGAGTEPGVGAGEGEGAGEGALLETVGALVIVGLDGSARAEAALPLAAAFARAYTRTLLLVRVVPRIVLAGGGPQTLRLVREAQADAEREALHYLRRLRRQLATQPVPPGHEPGPESGRGRGSGRLSVQTMLRTGEPAQELRALAEAHADSLLVVATHGRGAVRRVLAGSVALDLIHHSPVPLLIVPPPHPNDEHLTEGDFTGADMPGADTTEA